VEPALLADDQAVALEPLQRGLQRGARKPGKAECAEVAWMPAARSFQRGAGLDQRRARAAASGLAGQPRGRIKNWSAKAARPDEPPARCRGARAIASGCVRSRRERPAAGRDYGTRGKTTGAPGEAATPVSARAPVAPRTFVPERPHPDVHTHAFAARTK
jgi:hypothetical protein